MCVGATLANRELYVIFMRILHSFRIEQDGDFNGNPVTGIRDARELVAMPTPYKAYFIPRHQDLLESALFD